MSRLNPGNHFVPFAFVTILKMTIDRLIGCGKLAEEDVGPSFWKALRIKFSNASNYDDKKPKKKKMVKLFNYMLL